MATMRVRPSSAELLRGDAMDVGGWTIKKENWQKTCVSDETNGDQSTNHSNALIILTNKSPLILWSGENELFPVVQNWEEYVDDVIARLEDDFWTVCA